MKQPKKISTLGLTPGTPTMRALEADVEDWVEEKLLNDKDWGHLHIELSRTSVPVSVADLPWVPLWESISGFLTSAMTFDTFSQGLRPSACLPLLF